MLTACGVRDVWGSNQFSTLVNEKEGVMWNDLSKLDKYLYVRTNPYTVRIIGMLGVISVLLMALGYWDFIKINFFYLLVFGPIIFFVVTNKLFRYFIQIFYPSFKISVHEKFIQKFWSTHSRPSVDIFLPYAGEDLVVHEEVVKAATQLDYSNYKVYMLDDSANPGHKALAEKYGCVYLSRPNKGEWKKSGNLEFGYSRSSGEFIFVLDADFVPAPNALNDIVPYIARDPKIGILQTPQYFEQNKDVHTRSEIEFGGGNIVEDFYRIILPCRDEFQAAMCVGTSAFYRRAAIEKLNGTPKVHASEDLATGLLVTQHGYSVKYVPLIVSIGTSPDTYQGYFKQHQRWCSGNLVFAKYWPAAQLPLLARLVYLMNPTYYIGEAFSILFSFQFLVLLYFHTSSLSLTNTALFIPYMVLSRIIVPLTKVNKSKTGTRLAAINNTYTYLYTFISMAAKNIPQWHPTGLKIEGLHSDFLAANKVGVMISSIFLMSFTFVLLSRPEVFGNYNTYAILFWSFYTVYWHTAYLTKVGAYIHPIQIKAIKTFPGKLSLYARTHSTVGLFAVLCATILFNSYRASQDSNTITAVEIARLSGNPPPTTLTFATDRREWDFVAPAVLAATTETSKPLTFAHKVSPDETLPEVVSKIVQDFTIQKNVKISSTQKSIAVTNIQEFINDKTVVVGDTFELDGGLVENAVQDATEFTE